MNYKGMDALIRYYKYCDVDKLRRKSQKLIEEIQIITNSEERNRALITKLKVEYRELQSKFNNNEKEYGELVDRISKEFKTETLVLSDERYKDHLKYVLPIDTNLSKEWGDIELNLTFTMIDVDDDGNIVHRVRKTSNHMLHITKLPDWDSFVPDSALSALDQRIIMTQMQLKRVEEINQIVADSKADNIKYNEDTNEISRMLNIVRNITNEEKN